MRFGGLRFGSEFGLQPGLVTFPTPAFLGRATLPSAVELYVNDALRYQGQVQEGPFQLNRAPTVTGAGEMTVVVRDALGVERQVTTGYYVSPGLLRPGLSDFSLEVGAVRRDYGLRSNAYGQAFVAGAWRRGLSERLTIESRVELSEKVHNAGAGFTAVLPGLGEFGASAAISNGPDGSGTVGRLHASRVTPRWSISASYELRSRGFSQLGATPLDREVEEQLQLAGGLSFGRYGSLTAAIMDLRFDDGVRNRVSTLSYGLTLGERWFVNAFLLRSEVDNQPTVTTVGVSLTVPLGGRDSAYLQADQRSFSAEYRRHPPSASGFGYRAAVRAGDDRNLQADATWRTDFGEATLQTAYERSHLGARLLASGGLVAIGGEVHASRRIEGAVGLVEAADFPNVRIYQDNRLVARTGDDGRAIIPSLLPYQPNAIRLDMTDVPLEAPLASDAISLVPRQLGGVTARFALSEGRGATLVVRLPDGGLLEPGVKLVGADGAEVYSGFDGEVFLPHATEGATLTAERTAGRCVLRTPPLPVGERLPRLDPVACTPQGN